jgi:hypothetical protein
LTIIVSGLWLPVNSFIVDHPSTAAVNNWDLSWFSDPITDGGAAVALNLVHYGGAKTPPGIWKTMVVPEVTVSDKPDGTRSGANYTYSVMALEPALNCTVIPQSAISTRNFTYQVHAGREDEFNQVNGTLVAVRPPGIDPRCSDSSIDGYANLTFGIELEASYPRSIGKYFDLVQSAAGQVSTDCPSVGILFGMVAPFVETNLTALVCSQTIKQVPVRVTYNGSPSFRGIEDVQRQGDYRMVQNDAKAHTLGYKIEGFLNETLLPFSSYPSSETDYDSFFNHLILRPGRYTRSELEGAENEWLFVQAVTEEYDEYLRHVIHHNIRAKDQSSAINILSATNDSSTESFQSTTIGLYSAEITHLIIDPTSKLILQVLLGTMTILSAIGFLLVKIRGTLPRDPCSIGSTMALLTNSPLCDPGAGILPEDAQHLSESQLLKAVSGWVFSGKLI